MSDLYPLKLPPSFREKIWGKRDLGPLYGRQQSLIGEAWFSFEENRIVNGPLAGRTLGSLAAEFGPRLMGRSYEPSGLRRRSADEDPEEQPASAAYFPILSKFVFSRDQLSVQVHPDDEYALAHEGGPGKTEMWYIVDADPGARLALGLTKKLSKDELRRAAETGEIASYLNWVEVKKGQAFFVPPGTLHTIGAGIVLYEIQQNSDLTYRFFDFGRLGVGGEPRPLHIEDGVAVTSLDSHPGPQKAFLFPDDPLSRELVVACRYFAVEKLSFAEAAAYAPDPERMHVLVFLAGEGRIGSEDATQPTATQTSYDAGDAYLVPAEARPFELQPASGTTAIRAYVPDLDQLRLTLQAAGASNEQIRRLLY